MRSFTILVTLFIFLTLTSSADVVDIERKGENEMVEKFAPWPEDLEPSSQIVFRPLFVYKQRQAELHEQRRRKEELEASEVVEVTVPEKVTQTVTWHLRPPAPNQPYYPYYPTHYYYNPYGYNYGYYPYTSWPSRSSIRKYQ